MKKFILIILLPIFLIAGDKMRPEPMNDAVNSVQSDERSYFEIAMGKSVRPLTDEQLKNRVIYTNLIGVGAIALWGTAYWDYFTTAPVAGDEGWFGSDTKYGGVDKIGHMYSVYLFSLGFSSLFEYWGMSEEESFLYGPLTSWVFHGIMEVGDSFSESQGFSYEDLLMNTLGAAFYYVREKYPAVKKTVDFRLEYIPDLNSDQDIFTQYDSMKYLMALKFSGFESMKDTPLKYLELQVGYYTRGYEDHDAYPSKERVIYTAIGINSSEILKALGWTKTSEVLHYYQLPYTYIPFGHDLDSNRYIAP